MNSIITGNTKICIRLRSIVDTLLKGTTADRDKVADADIEDLHLLLQIIHRLLVTHVNGILRTIENTTCTTHTLNIRCQLRSMATLHDILDGVPGQEHIAGDMTGLIDNKKTQLVTFAKTMAADKPGNTGCIALE